MIIVTREVLIEKAPFMIQLVCGDYCDWWYMKLDGIFLEVITGGYTRRRRGGYVEYLKKGFYIITSGIYKGSIVSKEHSIKL